MGVTRRLSHFDDPSLQPWFIVAVFGAVLILLGIASFLVQLVVSFMKREQLRDLTGDPWHGRTLEWSTSSPPPPYNFAFTPIIHDQDAWWDMKRRGHARPLEGFRPIHMPKNTGAGVFLAGFSTVLAFALVWYIWWLAAVAFIGLLATAIGHTFNYNRDYYVPAAEVASFEHRRAQMARHAQVLAE
jgi:cytochrome o ubiquinol oxidase subunit I